MPKISEEPQFLDRTGARRTRDGKDMSFICVSIKMGREVVGALSADRPVAALSYLRKRAAAASLGITERIMGLRVHAYQIDPRTFKANIS